MNTVNTPCYTVEQGEDHYYVVGPEGVVASYLDFEKAMQAAREFAHKCFPKSWEKVPPAMRAAQRKYYHFTV